MTPQEASQTYWRLHSQRARHKPTRGDVVTVTQPMRNVIGLVVGVCSAGVLVEFPGIKDCDWIAPHNVKVLFCGHCGMPRSDHAGDKCLYEPTTYKPE